MVLRGGSALEIKIESGLIIKCENSKSLECGDVVHVMYDFTKNQVASIELAMHEGIEDGGFIHTEREKIHVSLWEE